MWANLKGFLSLELKFVIMSKCYSCSEALVGDNRSFEHIINNSIGGHKGSSELLCKNCNEVFGDTIDANLAGQLRDFAILLDAKRDRSLVEPRIKMTTINGDIKEVGYGMKPNIKLSFPTEEKQVELFTTESKYRKLVRTKTKELKEKGNVTFIKSSELPNKEKYYLKNDFSDGDGNRLFGGKLMHRSVAKMCVNRYLSQKYDPKYCTQIIDFIKGKLHPYPHFYYFPKTYEIYRPDEDEVSHLIHLRGDAKTRVLYAYIELFNFENAILIFDMNYDGEDFTDTYILNILSGMEVQKNVSIKLTRNHFEDLNLICQDFYSVYVARHNRLLQIIEKRQLRSLS